MDKVERAIARITMWLERRMTFQNAIRCGGLGGILHQIHQPESRDPALIFACLAMMGLPVPVKIDRDRKGGPE